LPIAETKDQLWVGSGKGLDRFNSERGEFTAVPVTRGGIEEEVIVISLIRSREGILWIGTLENGLFRIDGSGNPEQAAFYYPGDTSSISSNYISVIHEREREPGILW